MEIKTKSDYEKHLNNSKPIDVVKELTEHCWTGNDVSSIDKKCAKAYAERGLLGTCLRKYDPIAFEVGYKDWK